MNGNLYSVLREGFAGAWDRPALLDAAGRATTYGELDALSARFAAVLAALGVAPGDRVVVQVDKSVGAIALYLACLRLGAIHVPLNTAYTASEVSFFLRDCDPRVFVASPARSGGAALASAATIGADAGAPAIAPAPAAVTLGTTSDTALWAHALATPPDSRIASSSCDDLAAIVYTSGTTGVPKGAMLSHGNLASNARTLNALWGFSAGDVLLHALPIFHVHGLFVALHTAMLSGATILLLPKFDAAEVRRLLPRATVMMGVPTYYTRLLALDGFGRSDCTSMRLFLSGSAPLAATTHREFEDRTGMRILERYGMTETGMITSNPLDGDRVAGTVGFALPGVRLRIIREDGAPSAPGEAGVLEVAGPNVFRGYWRRPEQTAAGFRSDGFFVTGDIGVAGGDGRVTLVGRAKDLIISGGLNIYPKEIEEVLDAAGGVCESAVVGVPDADFGEAVVAVVVAAAGASPTADELMEAVRARLARFKHPRRIVFASELPRNAMGKVQKNLLRDWLSREAGPPGQFRPTPSGRSNV